jgi:Icc protein
VPITLPALSRRTFLAGSTLAALAVSRGWSDEPAASDPHRLILMADTHIPAAPDIEARGVCMHDNFVQAAKDVLALKSRASAAFILGDCAYLEGKVEDYALLVKVLEPLRSAGLPIHLALGNHDHRERFWKALPADDAQAKDVEAKHAMMIAAPRANVFILDSLDVTNKTPGVIGEQQLTWLAKALDKNSDRPALVGVHHNPDLKPMPGGLTDTQPLYDVLLPRKHVKALFFGHSHFWEIKELEGLHLVNLPPVAYAFAKGKPSGFVEMELAEDSANLRLHSLDKDHPLHGQETRLKWRA